jgi:hypothetical protein
MFGNTGNFARTIASTSIAPAHSRTKLTNAPFNSVRDKEEEEEEDDEDASTEDKEEVDKYPD